MNILKLFLSKFFTFNKYVSDYNRISYLTRKIYDLIYNYSEEDLRIELINSIEKSGDQELRHIIAIDNSYFIDSSESEKLKKIHNICIKLKEVKFKGLEKISEKFEKYYEIKKLKIDNKTTANNSFLEKLSKIGNDIYKVITSKLFMNVACIISATIALSTATMGIVPLVSFFGTLIVVSSSIIYDIYQMKKHKSLIQEREYLKSIESIHKEKDKLIEDNTKFNLFKDEKIEKEIKSPNKPSYLKSAIRVIKQKLPATTISLMLQIATLNPFSIAISFANSVMSHFTATLSRKDRANIRYLIKEDIHSRKNNNYIPEYKNLSDLKSIYLRKKAELEVLKENTSRNQDPIDNEFKKSIKDQIEEKIKQQDKKHVSLFRKIIKYMVVTLNPFYSENYIAKKVIDKIDVEKIKNDESNKFKTNQGKFLIFVDSVKHASVVASITLGIEYILTAAHVNLTMLTGMIFTSVTTSIISNVTSTNKEQYMFEKPMKDDNVRTELERKSKNASIKTGKVKAEEIGKVKADTTPPVPSKSDTANKRK